MLRAFGVFLVLLLMMAAMGLPVLADGDDFATVTPAFDYGSDAGMVFDSSAPVDDGEADYTLEYIGAALLAMFGFFVYDIVRNKNVIGGYEKLIARLTGDLVLAEALEANYLAMPDGLPKQTVDLLADIAKHLVKMTPNESDDKLAAWLDQLRDGLPSEPATGKD